MLPLSKCLLTKLLLLLVVVDFSLLGITVGNTPSRVNIGAEFAEVVGGGRALEVTRHPSHSATVVSSSMSLAGCE